MNGTLHTAAQAQEIQMFFQILDTGGDGVLQYEEFFGIIGTDYEVRCLRWPPFFARHACTTALCHCVKALLLQCIHQCGAKTGQFHLHPQAVGLLPAFNAHECKETPGTLLCRSSTRESCYRQTRWQSLQRCCHLILRMTQILRSRSLEVLRGAN